MWQKLLQKSAPLCYIKATCPDSTHAANSSGRSNLNSLAPWNESAWHFMVNAATRWQERRAVGGNVPWRSRFSSPSPPDTTSDNSLFRKHSQTGNLFCHLKKMTIHLLSSLINADLWSGCQICLLWLIKCQTLSFIHKKRIVGICWAVSFLYRILWMCSGSFEHDSDTMAPLMYSKYCSRLQLIGSRGRSKR